MDKPWLWALIARPFIWMAISVGIFWPVKSLIRNKMKDGKLKRLLLYRIS